jgi:hypothetical protein
MTWPKLLRKASWTLLLSIAILPIATASENATSALALLSTTNVVEPKKVLQNARDRLREQFDSWLKQPSEYRNRAVGECSVFPEGDIYPFALPAMAYCDLARRQSPLKTQATANAAKLIELLVPATSKRIRPPAGDLMRLANYQKQGTFLATLNITLGKFAPIDPSNKYKALHAHISQLLYRAMEDLDGKPIESYPEYTWYFDSIMALVSLRLFEEANRLPPRSKTLLDKHLGWRMKHARDGSTGLPIAHKAGLPRGCDLSMQICLLAEIDRPAAQQLYKTYVTHHWADYGVIAGFTEWPKGKNMLMAGDIDSGPLFLGIGMTATGVGLGAALSVDDSERVGRLARQLHRLPDFVKSVTSTGSQPVSLFDGAVPVNPSYLTGFLYGDAVLFYALRCGIR